MEFARRNKKKIKKKEMVAGASRQSKSRSGVEIVWGWGAHLKCAVTVL